jgi:hypothetical protein
MAVSQTLTLNIKTNTAQAEQATKGLVAKMGKQTLLTTTPIPVPHLGTAPH